MKNKKYITGFLFTSPSFLTGAGTVINLAGNYYEFNTCSSGIEADEMAIEHDFRMIGQDITDIMEDIGKKYKTIISK